MLTKILQTAAGRDETVRGLGMDTCGTPNLTQFLRLILQLKNKDGSLERMCEFFRWFGFQ